MSNKESVENDLREYLERENNLHRQGKLDYLRATFSKHLALQKLDHLVTKGDLFDIVSSAKNELRNMTLPMHVSGRKIDNTELNAIAMIEALVSYLNKHHLLKSVPKLDYTDESGQFDTMED